MKINDLEKVHPMKQVTVASIIQVAVFLFMLLAFWGNSKVFADEIVFKFKSPVSYTHLRAHETPEHGGRREGGG